MALTPLVFKWLGTFCFRSQAFCSGDKFASTTSPVSHSSDRYSKEIIPHYMTNKFNIEKIVKYLEKYKSDLLTLYTWNAKIERLIELETLTEVQEREINRLTPYENGIQLRKIVGQKLRETYESNKALFLKLCLWIIPDWGGIRTGSVKDISDLLKPFLKGINPDFNRIASSSKLGAFMYPEKYVIYDSRVAYSLNWIILSENAGQKFFPIPQGRNSKMSAFDLNVHIRSENISNYRIESLKDLDNRRFIINRDQDLFIDKKEAYSELNSLVRQINVKLWEGDPEKERNLYYTEMLLFSIADREVFMDITTRYSQFKDEVGAHGFPKI
jgi:hypothetical protein